MTAAARKRRSAMGLVGPGFVGAHHIDAVRRLGFVDVVAVAASSRRLGAREGRRARCPKAYGSYEALAADPDVHVVHNTTPNHLHVPVIMAALEHRKHIVSDKPLAHERRRSAALVDAARDAGVVHAVTFNYRGNPLVQQARAMIARGEIGAPHFVHGGYLQDWLLQPTDFSWRLEPDKGGSELGDRRHRIALVRSGAARRRPRIIERCSRISRRSYHAVQAAGKPRGICPTRAGGRRAPTVASVARARISRPCSCASRTARAGRVRRPGVCGSQERSLVRGQRPHGVGAVAAGTAERALDRPPRRGRTACCRRIRRCWREEARPYAHLPGGHQEAWADAFRNVMRRHLRLHRRAVEAPTSRSHRRSPRSRTAIVPRAWLTRFWRAIATAASGLACRLRRWRRPMKLGLFTPVFGGLGVEDMLAKVRSLGKVHGDRAGHRRVAGQRSRRPRCAAERQRTRRRDFRKMIARRRADDQRAVVPRQSAASRTRRDAQGRRRAVPQDGPLCRTPRGSGCGDVFRLSGRFRERHASELGDHALAARVSRGARMAVGRRRPFRTGRRPPHSRAITA